MTLMIFEIIFTYVEIIKNYIVTTVQIKIYIYGHFSPDPVVLVICVPLEHLHSHPKT